jgi:hypothetical protein
VNFVTLAALGALRHTAGAAASLAPGDDARGWCRELALKLEAYEIFRRGPSVGPRLTEGVARALDAPAGRIVWTIEGLAHAHAERQRGEDPAWLGEAVRGAPAGARVPTLCGIGMALAERRLRGLAAATAAEQERAIAADLATWRQALPAASAELLVEAQGFAARLLYPAIVPALGSRWAGVGRDAGACFWHGVGRASYFDVRYTVPGSGAPWRSALLRGAADEEIRTSLLAGLAFAVALVTMRAPRILEAMLRDQAARPDHLAAVAHGVRSAIVVWHAAAAHDPGLAAWRQYTPRSEGTACLWREWIAEPCARALASDVEAAVGAPASLFHYRP